MFLTTFFFSIWLIKVSLLDVFIETGPCPGPISVDRPISGKSWIGRLDALSRLGIGRTGSDHGLELMACGAFSKHMTRNRPAMRNLSSTIGNPTVSAHGILRLPAVRTTAPVPNHPKGRYALAALLQEVKRGPRAPLNDDKSHTYGRTSQPECHIPR